MHDPMKDCENTLGAKFKDKYTGAWGCGRNTGRRGLFLWLWLKFPPSRLSFPDFIQLEEKAAENK